jgi:putative transposase
LRSWLEILLLGWACTTTIAGGLIAGHGRFPTYYGGEFTGQLVGLWAYHHSVRIVFSRRGKPTDNAFIETLNGTPRDERLNLHWFDDIAQATQLIGAWRVDYNESRFHMALGNLPPAEYAARAGTSHNTRGLSAAQN